MIKKLKYIEKEALLQVVKLFKSIHTKSRLTVEGKIDLGNDLLTIVKDGEVVLVIEVIEQDDFFAIVRIEFPKKEVNKNIDISLLGKKYYLQINKIDLTAQTILYSDYSSEGEFLELEDGYQDKKLYDKLNLLLYRSIQEYLA